MRSLSNVIKYERVYFNQEEKKLIDSNDKGGFTPISFRNNEHIMMPSSEESEDEFVSEEEREDVDPEAFLMEEREHFLEEAEKILADAKAQADFILRQAKEKASQLHEQGLAGGRELGYQEGKIQAQAELQQELDRLSEKEADLEADYQNRLQQLEPSMVELTIGLVQNITGVLMEGRESILTNLVKRALGQVKRNDTFIIKVGHEDYPRIYQERGTLLQCIGEGKSLEIEEDSSLALGQCMIETDDRIIDCGVDTQLEGLFENLRLLSRC